MYKVERAIILAAGKGERLHPVTDTTPKPLVKVNGVMIIDTIIQALLLNGIEEIVIVIGYLKEEFSILLQKYPNLKFIENPNYAIHNNISSVYLAREYLENAILIDGDQIIKDPSVFKPEFTKSGYNACWTDSKTSEWILEVVNECVVSCNRYGGECGWQLYGISRWAKEDARKLKKHIELEYIEKNNTQIYWDDVALFCYANEYNLGITKMNNHSVIEIDSIDELIELDSSYRV